MDLMLLAYTEEQLIAHYTKAREEIYQEWKQIHRKSRSAFQVRKARLDSRKRYADELKLSPFERRQVFIEELNRRIFELERRLKVKAELS